MNSKRKLDDLIDDLLLPPLTPSTTTSCVRKDHPTLPSLTPHPRSSSPSTSSTPSLPSSSSPHESTPRGKHPRIQFFIRIFSDKTLVMVADRNDVVFTLHQRILAITKIPINEQRLIYNGKQLQSDKTLSECCLSNDSCLQLVGRLRSTGHPKAWQLIVDFTGLVFSLCRLGPDCIYVSSYGGMMMKNEPNGSMIKAFISKFLSMITKQNDVEEYRGHFEVFMTSSTPLALVTLYMSEFITNRVIASDAIKHFVNESRNTLPKDVYRLCVPIVLEFCKLLGSRVGTSDPLYIFCRGSLGSMVGDNGGRTEGDYSLGSCDVKDLIDVREIFQLVSELKGKLLDGLILSSGSEPFEGLSADDVRDFSAFLFAIRNGIISTLGDGSVVRFPLPKGNDSEEIDFLHGVFKDLMGRMESCLEKMEGRFAMIGKENLGQMSSRWDQYLAILKELNSIAKVLEGAEELFWGSLEQRKESLCYLIVKFAKRADDNNWILVRKEFTSFEARRHLVLMMLPDVKDEYGELHEMLIDRSRLLEESFAYIGRAEAESLHGGIFMEFKNEEATGPGVLREWFFLVCQAIFNPQNALFVACPNDRRRFFPNPASKVDPLHLEYFSFSGRVIALALMHKIQVGIVFDRVFFVQLAGKNISLEDICDADPYLYNSCKTILEMDAAIVDQDALGLTFIREVYELGTRKVVELCPGGKNISVTSKNRKEYVHLLIQHNFVTSIAEQVAHFTQGFADIMNKADTKARALLQKSLFESIDLEDFDWMLHGSVSTICVEDWMAHTEYEGFKETDPQICWFWKIVGKMSAEQRKVLLFFWTSIKFLPVEGFRGLASPLHINRTHESSDRLPSSHTCFYSLCFPPYPSEKIMQDRLDLITQEHVSCSFGTW